MNVQSGLPQEAEPCTCLLCLSCGWFACVRACVLTLCAAGAPAGCGGAGGSGGMISKEVGEAVSAAIKAHL